MDESMSEELLVYSFAPRTGKNSLFYDFMADTNVGGGRGPLDDIRRAKDVCAVGNNRIIHNVTEPDGIFSLPRFILTDGLVH